MEQSEQHSQGEAPDPTSEPSPGDTGASQSESTPDPQPDVSSPETTEQESSSELSSEAESGSSPGPLAGTSSEREPGVGGTGDHPAPAAMRDEEGNLHVAGEPPAGTGEATEAPAGDDPDVRSGDLSPEAEKARDQEHEPAQQPIDRPDIGTR